MISELYEIAQELAEKVDLTEGVEVTPYVDLAPDYDLAKVDKQIIFVTPQSLVRTPDTRRTDVIEAVYNIGICERISPDEIKNRLIMVDNIGKDLLNARFIVNAASRVKKVEYDPIYDADFLRNMNVFVSVIVVTVQVYNA